MARRKGRFDILCAGELLIDFISEQFADNLEEAATFRRLQGGSPANLCMNLARLGNKTLLAATVGQDDMGGFLEKMVQKAGVDTQLIGKANLPTTLILVTRSKEVSNFEAYRMADAQITQEQFPETLISDCSIFHTTCFALSLQPARDAILQAMSIAAKAGVQVSLDANYAGKIWANQEEAQRIVAQICQLGALIKVSEVDWERLYGMPLKSPSMAVDHFLHLGAKQVCVTLGSEGCYVANMEEQHFLPARKIEVKDTTGAGDAFWSGYLHGWLEGHKPLSCALAGRKMAEIKLGHFGPLTHNVNPEVLYEDVVQ